MKIILFGKNGQLGTAFQRFLPSLGEVIPLGRDNLDITNPSAIRDVLIELDPDLIINASAYTEVDLAEEQSEMATKANAIAPGVMAETARILNAVFVHYSTDYVFNGRHTIPYNENDRTDPLNIYGKSKLMGEENIKQAGKVYLILRTSWVYSMQGNSFVNKVLRWARRNEFLKIVNDQISSPTWAHDLAKTTSRILEQYEAKLFERIGEKSGLYHLAGSGYTSRYEWAKQILANDPNRNEQLVRSVEPVSSDAFSTPAMRPLFSALDCSKFENTFNIKMSGWETSLYEAMRE